ncbi:MAG: radical SAM protein [Sulfurospirillaceae bacterium]|nr:radical SAM protein [Sulfurospirillaceae bacterium]
MENIIFGPVTSRRFGQSLGVDLSPNKKQCNFDCLYCELKGAKTVTKAQDTPTCKEVLNAIENALKEYKNIDVLTLTANGEPTLYPELDELVDGINRLKKDFKLLILSNGSTIDNDDIQKTLCKIDIVKLSLDCATQKCFKKLDRPAKGIEITHIIDGMKRFAKIFKNTLVVEILVVEGINDTVGEFEALQEVLVQIAPHRVDVGTIDRPPAYNVKGVSVMRLIELAKCLKGLHVSIAYKKDYAPEKRGFSKEQIIEMLKLRPQSTNDIDFSFDAKSVEILKDLVKQGIVFTRNVGGTEFYTTH